MRRYLRDGIGIRALRTIALAALILAVLPSLANADYCSSLINPGTSVLGMSGAGPFNSIILVSMLIMLLMINVAVFLFLIGYAFNIQSVSSMAKAELGEIAVTVAIVLVFLGTFQALSWTGPSGLPPGNFLALSPGTMGPNVFTTDCESLSTAVNTIIGDLAGILFNQQVIALISNMTFSFGYAGMISASMSPLSGLLMQSVFIGTVLNIAIVLIALPLASTIILSVIFSLFPIFFFAGIILRTIPWTRAAGGAFLGLFIGFYIVFPLLLYLMVTQLNVAVITAQSQTTTVLQSINPTSTAFPGFQSLGFGIVGNFIENDASPVIYILFGIVISFMIAFDFMEVMGDLLGAPSLRSSQALKNIV